MLYEVKVYYKNFDCFGLKRNFVSISCFRNLKNAKAFAEQVEKNNAFMCEAVETSIKPHKTAKWYILEEHYSAQKGTYYVQTFPRD